VKRSDTSTGPKSCAPLVAVRVHGAHELVERLVPLIVGIEGRVRLERLGKLLAGALPPLHVDELTVDVERDSPTVPPASARTANDTVALLAPRRSSSRHTSLRGETARDAGTFTTLIAAIDRAGLEPTLAGEGPFTVFAPSDAAFAQLPRGTVESLLAEPDKLTQVLTYHVVPGRVTAADVVGLTKAPTVQGEELSVSVDGSIHVDAARVTSADIEASNGLIHVIDRVLLPAAT